MTSPYDSPDYHALIRGMRQIDRAGGDSTIARLVTADWLQDHGEEERAEFVRVQCGDASAGDPIARILGGILSGLSWVTCGASPAFDWSWSGGIHTCTDDPVTIRLRSDDTLDYSRGFISRVECHLTFWLTHGPDICRQHPVREVVITDRTVTGETTGYMWARRRDNGMDFPYSLPPVIWDRLPDVWQVTGLFKCYLWPSAAVSALNAAALRWAEAEADSITPPV